MGERDLLLWISYGPHVWVALVTHEWVAWVTHEWGTLKTCSRSFFSPIKALGDKGCSDGMGSDFG